MSVVVVCVVVSITFIDAKLPQNRFNQCAQFRNYIIFTSCRITHISILKSLFYLFKALSLYDFTWFLFFLMRCNNNNFFLCSFDRSIECSKLSNQHANFERRMRSQAQWNKKVSNHRELCICHDKISNIITMCSNKKCFLCYFKMYTCRLFKCWMTTTNIL